jgi:glycosyltransferase involved in cell wall biosynthesis
LDKNNKSIIVWPSSFFPVIGGLQTATLEIAKYLKSNNWDVSIVSNRYPRNLSSKDEVEDIVINRFTLLHSPVTYLKSGRLDLFFAWFIFKPITLFNLLFCFKKYKPDVVHVHFLDNQVFEVYLLKKIFEFKLIISFHGNDIEKIKSLNKKSVQYYLIQKVINEADSITGCSDYIKTQLSKAFIKLNTKKLFTLYNGVRNGFNSQKFENKKNGSILLAARNVPSKGPDMLFELAYKYDRKKFIIAGAGYNRKIIIPNVEILGPLGIDDLTKEYLSSSITIIPSRNEAFGIVIAEALCCGSPVVATNVGGIPEVIKIAQTNLSVKEKEIFGKWVTLVEPTVESLSNGISHIMNNKNSIEEYLKIIPKIRTQFLWETRLDDFYNSNIMGAN